MQRSFLGLFFLLVLPTLVFAVTADEYYQAALSLYKAKDYENAFRYYEAAAQTDPLHWKAFQSMGHCRYRQNRLGEALLYYEKSLALNPDNLELKKVADSLIASGVTAPRPTPPPAMAPATTTPAPASTPRGAPASSNAPADLSRPRRGFGFRGGLNWNTLKGPDASGAHVRGGYEAAAFYWMELTRAVRLQPEVVVTQRKHFMGGTEAVSAPYPGGVVTTSWISEAEVNALFVDVPLLARFTAASRPPRIRFFAGPVAQVLLKARQKGALKTVVTDTPDFGPITSVLESTALDGDLKPYAKTVSAGATGGMGVEIAGVELDVRYTTGLSGAFRGLNAKYATLSATVGYGF